jgi:hypothetical protein
MYQTCGFLLVLFDFLLAARLLRVRTDWTFTNLDRATICNLQVFFSRYVLMEFTIIDGELTVLREGQIEYVFERDSLSRAAYQYMIRWIQDSKSPDDDPGAAWLEAEKAWDALSPEMQGMIIAIANKEKQQARDIRDGLLATLHGYQGVKRVKDTYAECIRTCFGQLN